jgi:flagellar M-ring protein FliF
MATATTAQDRGGELQVGNRLQDNPIFRQIAVMVGIAASVAFGVAVVLWSQTPSFSPLYGNLPQKDAMEIAQALQTAGIEYKIDQSNGIVMVPSSDLQQARMKLAGQGLPQSGSVGFELMQEDTGFTTSRLAESARYQRAMEGELARSVMTLANVESARVHLATPKQSVFIRKRKYPSASVVIKLYPGRNLEKGQVEAITHLVASSVPELEASNVTVVDQRGNLLSSKKDSREMALTSSQFEYTRGLEAHFKQRVEDILAPLVGRENLRAEVTADMDFTMTEQTQEYFNPDSNALRSEQINEQQSRQGEVQGVPGALSNQPPATGTAPQVATGGAAGQEGGTPLNTSKRATRNYEVDKTVSHTRLPGNRLRRLSVAVVVNDRYVTGEDGKLKAVERTPEEISRISSLIKDAIGYNVKRGDSVQVINESFFVPEQPEPLPAVPLWEQPKFWDWVRQGGGWLLALLLIVGVLRPAMNKLMKQASVSRGTNDMAIAAAGASGMPGAHGGMGGQEVGALGVDDGALHLPGPRTYEKTLDAARNMISDDPKRVAQVVRKWISEDGRH